MYSGNAVVVNFLMRFPVLVPIAVAAGITAATAKLAPVPVQPPRIEAKAPVKQPVITTITKKKIRE